MELRNTWADTTVPKPQSSIIAEKRRKPLNSLARTYEKGIGYSPDHSDIKFIPSVLLVELLFITLTIVDMSTTSWQKPSSEISCACRLNVKRASETGFSGGARTTPRAVMDCYPKPGRSGQIKVQQLFYERWRSLPGALHQIGR